ncbi:MAG: TonB family protein [Myxococcales bacterium]|nr:TonB family protein [Myxococcales bacterium]
MRQRFVVKFAHGAVTLIGLGLATICHGQTPPPFAVALPAAASAAEALVPPKALTATTIEYPVDAPEQASPVVVKIKIVVDSTGNVKKVEPLPPAQSPFDAAVVAAAKNFRFSPASYKGKAVAVEIVFSHTFFPPVKSSFAASKPGGPLLDSLLRGRLVEKGTRVPVTGATVDALINGLHYSGEADMRGRFRLAVPAGEAIVTVHAAGYKAFLQREKLVSRQELAIAYYVERERYDPYEILVFGEKKRDEISRITLKGAEIRQVPGTFGDPFRVIQALPGVSSIVSLLPFPVVRGASPGSTGYLVDGTRVPLLYHLLAGPSVIHPEFIDEVQFYPGMAPVLYGGYSAGIVDGRTRRAYRDEKVVDFDVNMLQAGAFVRHPVPMIDATASVAGRIGYPGTLISLATDQVSLSYWDYQLRLDGGTTRKGWTVFAFGAADTVSTPAAGTPPETVKPPLEPSLRLAFHRLDLRYQLTDNKWEHNYRVVAGVDESLAGTTKIGTYLVEPILRWKYRPNPDTEVIVGTEGSFRYLMAADITPTQDPELSLFGQDLSKQYVASALTEVLWRPTPRWLVRPGVRVDWRHDGTTAATGVDPRLTVRYHLLSLDLPQDATKGDDRSVWLKGGIGVFHQPPRFFLPLPGLDVMPLRFGLLRSIQSSLGVEIPVTDGVGLNVEGYFNYMDPVVFDLQTNPQSIINLGPSVMPGSLPDPNSSNQNQAQQTFDRLFLPQRGRAYGIETLLRRQSRHGLYGWIAYTLSMSERENLGSWAPYDYDRTHLLNVVAGLPLPRNWDVGVRFQYQSGKPATTTYGFNTARTDGYLRIDIRIDKRAVWNKWLFDFYVDLTNVTLLPEEVSPGDTIRYVLPTVGVRGRF